MSKNLPFSIPAQPWEELPELMALPSIGEMAAQPLYAAPNRHSNASKRSRRTSPYGFDFLGRPFRKGDIVLATVSGDHTYVEIEEIFLDDTKGQPYGNWNHFLMDSRSRELFVHGIAENPSKSGKWERVMWSVDPEWRAPFLGLFPDTRLVYGQKRNAPQGLEAVEGQSFKLRALAVGVEKASRLTISSESVSVFGAPLDARTVALQRAAMKMPRSDVHIPIGDPDSW